MIDLDNQTTSKVSEASPPGFWVAKGQMFCDYPMDKICEVASFGSKVRSIALTGFHAEGSDPTLADSLNEGCRRTPEF